MYLVQPLLFPYSAFQILFDGFLVVLNFSFRKCIVNFSTDYHTQLHILIVNDTKFILPWTHSNYVNAFLFFFHSNFSILFFKLRINNVLNVLANNLSTGRYFFFFFFTRTLLVIMLAMTKPNQLYRNLSVCYVRVFIFPEHWKPEHFVLFRGVPFM